MEVIKDLVDALVGDGLVKMDKIGISNYYWSFPSDVRKARDKRLSDLRAAIGVEENRKEQLEGKLESAYAEREQNVRALHGIDDRMRGKFSNSALQSDRRN